MQLSYRGVNYQTSAIKLPNIVNLIVAKYRGADYTIPQRNITINKPNTEFKYRGVSYQPTVTYPTNKIQPAFQLN